MLDATYTLTQVTQGKGDLIPEITFSEMKLSQNINQIIYIAPCYIRTGL